MCPTVMTKDGREIGSVKSLREYGIETPVASGCLCDVNLEEVLGDNWISTKELKARAYYRDIWTFLIEYYEVDEFGETFPEKRPITRKERKRMKNSTFRQQRQRG